MIIATAPIGLAAIAIARTAALHRRVRRTGTTGVTSRQQWSFWLGIAALFAAAGLAAGPFAAARPVTAHVLVFTLVGLTGVPLVMLSLPEWWVRPRLARLRAYRLARIVSNPWFGGPVAVATVVGTHLPWTAEHLPGGVGGTAVLVAVWVGGGVLAWLPVFSPLLEHRLSQPSHRCGHLLATLGFTPMLPGEFLMSGTVPVIGLDTTAGADIRGLADQHLAGALMHLLVVPLVWVVIVAVWAGATRADRAASASRQVHPSAGIEPARVRRRVDPTH